MTIDTALARIATGWRIRYDDDVFIVYNIEYGIRDRYVTNDRDFALEFYNHVVENSLPSNPISC